MEQAASDFEAAAADAAAASVPAPAQGSVKGGGAADDVAKSSSRRQQKGVKDAGAARRARIEAATAGVRAAAAAGGFQRAVAAFSAHLDRHLREFMRRLREDSRAQYHSHLSNLLTRLDYNGFFGGGGLEGVGDGGVGVLCDGRGFG